MNNAELLKELCLAFGPSGNEDDVRNIIKRELSLLCNNIEEDCLGNITVNIAGTINKTLMICAHMDEVGFMIDEICDDGTLHFSHLGGIDSSVLTGKPVRVGKKRLPGIISSVPFHLLPKDKRLSPPDEDELYIDIGAKDRNEAEKYVDLGDNATFDSSFFFFGDHKIKCKALDDRLGVFIMIEMIKEIRNLGIVPCFNVCFAFTVREEIGFSGAGVCARNVKPDAGIVLETTAVGDIFGTPGHKTVALLGNGGVVSPLDRGSIYPEKFVDFALATARENGVSAQIKQYVSGGNDASHIGRIGNGVPVIALSAPTRYLHSPSCVVDERDIISMQKHLRYMITDCRIEEVLK